MIDTTKPVDRTGNKWCGPLVLAAIMGTSTGEVCEALAVERQLTRGVRLSNGKIKRVRGRTADTMRGTYDTELFALLERNGFVLESIDVGARYRPGRHSTYVNDAGTRYASPRPPIFTTETWWPWTVLVRDCLPLWRWLLRVRNDNNAYIVHLPNHWAITARGMWCETHTKGDWIRAAQAPQGRRKVLKAWRVTRPGESHGN